MNVAYRQFAKRIPAVLMLTVEYWDQNDEVAVRTKRQTRKELFKELLEIGDESAGVVAKFGMSDIQDVLDVAFVESEQDYNKRKAEQTRKRLEGAARDIAHCYNCTVGSMDFIKALESELDRFQTYREGMREDGLCMGWGVTSEQWSDEYNASNSDTYHVYEIFEWLEQECPMLMAQYREQQLKESKNEQN